MTRVNGIGLMGTDAYTFQDVLVVDQIDSGWFCEIDGCRVFLTRPQVEPGSIVPTSGTRGPLTIAAVAIGDVQAKLARLGYRRSPSL